MLWGRRTEYHNSRTYEAEEPPVSQFGLMLAWIALKVRKMLKAGKHPSSSTVLLADGERHFSVLGTGGRRDRPDDCPFPTRPPAATNDWRVLP